MRSPSILIIDSGIGGLSIARDVKIKVPWAHIDYLADIEQHPYGQKTDTEIIKRVQTLIQQSIPVFHPDLVIIACNTASTIALNELRQLFKIPFIGVVPAIKPAVLLSETGIIGVLATKGTVNRQYTKDLIHEFANNKEVYLHGSIDLVLMSEEKIQGKPIDIQLLKKDVEILHSKSMGMDTIVLACTHFPIIKEELKSALPDIKHWIDSGEAIGRRTLYCLEELGFRDNDKENSNNSKNNFICTSRTGAYDRKLIKKYLGDFYQSILDIRN